MAGNFCSWKKKSALLNDSDVDLKNILSLLMGKWLFYFTPEVVQIRRTFFPLGNPPYAKKNKRDSLYSD